MLNYNIYNIKLEIRKYDCLLFKIFSPFYKKNKLFDKHFQNYDKENIGTVSKERLIKALSIRRMLELITNRELDAVHKCFSVERGGRLEIDYRAFLRALYLLQENKRTLLF